MFFLMAPLGILSFKKLVKLLVKVNAKVYKPFYEPLWKHEDFRNATFSSSHLNDKKNNTMQINL